VFFAQSIPLFSVFAATRATVLRNFPLVTSFKTTVYFVDNKPKVETDSKEKLFVLLQKGSDFIYTQ
jgi:hypothetical protein